MEKDEAKETWLPEVRVVHARGITNGMVFTNANKHFYQLQNDSPGYLSISNADPTRSSLPLSSSSPIPPIYRATSLSPPPPLSTRRRRTFDHPHSPCNLENDRAEPRASQIFDTRRLGRKEKDAVFRIRPSRGWKRKSGEQKDEDEYGRESVEEGEGGKTEGWLEVLPPRWRLISPKSTERQIPERNVAG